VDPEGGQRKRERKGGREREIDREEREKRRRAERRAETFAASGLSARRQVDWRFSRGKRMLVTLPTAATTWAMMTTSRGLD
jgi:hypothetical protein